MASTENNIVTAPLTERLLATMPRRENAKGLTISPRLINPDGPEAASELERLQGEVERLLSLLRRVEPHLDAIICFASDMGEHEPNRLAVDVRTALAKLDTTP